VPLQRNHLPRPAIERPSDVECDRPEKLRMENGGGKVQEGAAGCPFRETYRCKASWTLPTNSADGVRVASPSSFHFEGQTSVGFLAM
jgi:hypothetical protein